VDPSPITRVDEYRGEPQVVLAATQLGLEYSATQAARVVSEWIDFFLAGPCAIEELRFVTRTPRRLFEALRNQTQLRVLHLKWGDYADLSVLSGFRELHTLRLAGASGVQDLAPLTALQSVRVLSLESLKRAHDLSPLGEMRAVTSLDVGGDWMSSRNAHVNSIAFLRQIPQLQRLLLHTIIVDDRDYSPILDLPALREVRVMATRGMRPTRDELKALPAWSENGKWP
jgi:hypothetical protein